MARIRTLKPEALLHRKVGRLSDRAFRLWIAMILQADDDGRLVADPGQLRAVAFGFQDRTKTKDVEGALQEITKSGLVRVYEVEGIRYADFPSWRDHQRIDRAYPSKLPSYEGSKNAQRTLDDDSLNARHGSEGIGGEGIGGEGVGGGEREPSPPASTPSKDNGLDPELANLLAECPELLLVASPASSGFWEHVLGACEEAKAGDSWTAAKVRQWDQWFRSNPARRSKTRQKLEARLMGWLTKDLERLARRPA